MAWQELRLNPTFELRSLYDKEDKSRFFYFPSSSFLLTSLFTHNNKNNIMSAGIRQAFKTAHDEGTCSITLVRDCR